MRVIARSTLQSFWRKHAEAEQPLKAWLDEAQAADWQNPAELRAKYRSVSILQGGRAVFNIAGNKSRLVVAISYKLQIAFVKFIGTHRQYDQIDAQTMDQTKKGEA